MIVASVIQEVIAANTNAEGRVYPMRAPQGTPYPYIIVRKASGEEGLDLAGSADRLEEADIDITIAGLDYASARRTAEQVRDHLHGFRGDMGDQTKTPVRHCRKTSDNDASEPRRGDSSDEWVHEVSLSFVLWLRTDTAA